MSKVFKSIAPGSSATIEFAGVDGNVTVYVRRNMGAIDLSATAAPALALAILEAAGVEPIDHSNVGCTDGSPEALEEITFWLTGYVMEAAKTAKEAADRESLEHEALELLNGFRAAAGHPPHKRLSDTGDVVERWRAVARKAREIHGSTK